MAHERFLDEFFNATKEINFMKFILAREKNACIVTDALIFEYIKKHLKSQTFHLECGLCRVDDIDNFIATHERTKDFFVFAYGKELKITMDMRNKFNAKRFFSMKNDITPYLLSSKPTQFSDSCSERWKVPHVYTIFSIARSGSSYLCDLLAKQGLGFPKEHLRRPLRYMIRNTNQDDFDFNYFVKKLIVAEHNDHVFGTKLISTFLLTTTGAMNKRNVALLKDLDPKIIYLYREDKFLQAISAFIALQVGSFHAYTDAEAEEIHRCELQYDFNMILEQYNELLRQEQNLATFMNNLGTPFLRISYEKELNQDPKTTISKIIDYIGCHKRHDNNNLIVRKKLRTGISYEYAERFCKEYSQKVCKEKPQAIIGGLSRN